LHNGICTFLNARPTTSKQEQNDFDFKGHIANRLWMASCYYFAIMSAIIK